ncbi:unnamed protein product, partial [Ectocarpus sp. 12 AP-2014]
VFVFFCRSATPTPPPFLAAGSTRMRALGTSQVCATGGNRPLRLTYVFVVLSPLGPNISPRFDGRTGIFSWVFLPSPAKGRARVQLSNHPSMDKELLRKHHRRRGTNTTLEVVRCAFLSTGIAHASAPPLPPLLSRVTSTGLSFQQQTSRSTQASWIDRL